MCYWLVVKCMKIKGSLTLLNVLRNRDSLSAGINVTELVDLRYTLYATCGERERDKTAGRTSGGPSSLTWHSVLSSLHY